MHPLFVGSGVALITPFEQGGVNERVLAELVDFQIAEGSDALVVCGSTGEAATMTPEEQARVVEVTVEAAAGRVPVVAGVGGSDTAAVSNLARNAKRAQADALLISAPPYNKPTQRGIVAHYREVMKAGDLPTIIYNVPSRTSCNILPETVEEIATDRRVVGVKEASGDISQAAELCRRIADRIAVYSGNDDQVIPLMALGGRGVISVVGNIAPRDTSRMVHLFLEGRVEEAREIQFRYLPLAKALFCEPNPVPIKAAVKWLGFEVGDVRLPLTDLTEAGESLVREKLAEVGVEARAGV